MLPLSNIVLLNERRETTKIRTAESLGWLQTTAQIRHHGLRTMKRTPLTQFVQFAAPLVHDFFLHFVQK